MINHTMVLTINGTRRSEKAGGLDDGEVSTFENKPGEYREDLSTVEDLIENINHSAYMRGEWISSMKLDGRDIVEEHAIKILQENMLNIGERHVLIARGRDYKDVSPLRGVYAGASASGVFVKVEITKEA